MIKKYTFWILLMMIGVNVACLQLILFYKSQSLQLCQAQTPYNDSKILPQGSEILAVPIHLSCGLVIVEAPQKLHLEKLNKLCTLAVSSYGAAKGFHWKAAFVSRGDCSRCLNGERFKGIDDKLAGFTVFKYQILFVISDMDDVEFETTFVHEIFHALQMYYNRDDGSNQENLAEEFTERLGFGK